MAERKAWWEILRDQFASRGLLDPESERVQETVRALPAVKRQSRGLLSLDPQAESDTALEMSLGALPGVGQAMALRDLERARRAKDPAAAAMAASNFIPFGALLNRFRRGPISELDVYHATPHRFEPTPSNQLGEFDASKIGTGEGAQVYGHGIYTAESPKTAQSYYDQFKQQIQGSFDTVIDRRLDAFMQEFGGDAQKAADRFMAGVYDTPKNKAAMRKEVLERLEARTRQPYMLKADIPDEMIDRMLDWDKPLSEQNIDLQRFAPEMRKRIQSIPSSFGTLDVPLEVAADMLKSKTGMELYKMLVDQYDNKTASQMLKDAGIPGIRYLDEGSRNTAGKWIAKHPMGGENAFNTEAELNAFLKRNPEMAAVKPKQTRNFVVFPGEEKKVKILERK